MAGEGAVGDGISVCTFLRKIRGAGGVRDTSRALMAPKGSLSNRKNGPFRGTVKFVRNPERISHSACASSLT